MPKPKYEIVQADLEALAADPRTTLRAMGDLAARCFVSADFELTNAEAIQEFILDVRQPASDKGLLARDIGDMDSKTGAERLRRLRELYTMRNQVLSNARKAMREGVFIMGQAAQAARFVKAISDASKETLPPEADPATRAIIETAAARLNRLGRMHARRTARELRAREHDVVARIGTDPPADDTAAA